MPSYIELDKNGSVPASSDVSKIIVSIDTSGEIILTDSAGSSSYPTSKPQLTYTGIDLSSGPYAIPGNGVYEIVNAYGSISFPDPSTLNGLYITIINTDLTYNTTIDNSNTYAPYGKGGSDQLSVIGASDMFQFVSIGGKWRGGSFKL